MHVHVCDPKQKYNKKKIVFKRILLNSCYLMQCINIKKIVVFDAIKLWITEYWYLKHFIHQYKLTKTHI